MRRGRQSGAPTVAMPYLARIFRSVRRSWVPPLPLPSRSAGGARKSAGRVGLSWQRMNVLTKLCERYVLVHGDTVAHDVQVGPGKVNDFFAAAILDVCIANVPLARDRPIKDLCARRHLIRLQRNVRTNFTQRLSHAIAGDAAAYGEYLGSKREDFLAYVLRDKLFAKTPLQIHDVAPDLRSLCA